MTSLPSPMCLGSGVRESRVTTVDTAALVRVHEVDPLKDGRWQAFLHRHPGSSIFHSVGWLNSLSRTYGYEPVVYTTSPPTSDLENGLLFCRIRSWATGKRLVSLPFSDHCAFLCDAEDQLEALLLELRNRVLQERRTYLEVRPFGQNICSSAQKLELKQTANYVLHRIDLEPSWPEIFGRFHKSCVQRRIRHAERAGFVEVCGRSEKLLNDFFRLMLRTRARHGLPPHPFVWFKNVCECLGSAADIRVAYVRNVPAAAVLILHFKNTSYYKYGCSDETFHNLGVMPFLLWRAIMNAKSIGSRVFDLGRTSIDQHSLIAFKNHWCPTSQPLTYWRFPSRLFGGFVKGWKLRVVNRICSHMPHRLLQSAGALVYRHIG